MIFYLFGGIFIGLVRDWHLRRRRFDQLSEEYHPIRQEMQQNALDGAFDPINEIFEYDPDQIDSRVVHSYKSRTFDFVLTHDKIEKGYLLEKEGENNRDIFISFAPKEKYWVEEATHYLRGRLNNEGLIENSLDTLRKGYSIKIDNDEICRESFL